MRYEGHFAKALRLCRAPIPTTTQAMKVHATIIARGCWVGEATFFTPPGFTPKEPIVGDAAGVYEALTSCGERADDAVRTGHSSYLTSACGILDDAARRYPKRFARVVAEASQAFLP